MTDRDAELREEVRSMVRRHDPEPDALRALAEDFQQLADRYESVNEVI